MLPIPEDTRRDVKRECTVPVVRKRDPAGLARAVSFQNALPLPYSVMVTARAASPDAPAGEGEDRSERAEQRAVSERARA